MCPERHIFYVVLFVCVIVCLVLSPHSNSIDKALFRDDPARVLK
jgi:hypothetical protein